MMSLGGLLISFLYLLLQIAAVILVAYLTVWACRIFGLEIDGNVYRIGKVIVGLICLILVVVWLFSVLGGTATTPRFLVRP